MTNKLKFKEQTFKVVDLDEMQITINKVYNIDFNIPCDQECGNDIYLTFTVETGQNTGQNTDKYEKAAIKRLLNGKNETYMLGILLNDMCDKNIIPVGNYLISISW